MAGVNKGGEHGQEATEGVEVRTLHRYGYRSGEWARIAQVMELPDPHVWLVTFPDGDADWWVAGDPDAEYEFRGLGTEVPGG